MKLPSISEINKQTGIPKTSIEGYLRIFKGVLSEYEKNPSEISQTINTIHLWHQQGFSKVEIENKLTKGDAPPKAIRASQPKRKQQPETANLQILSEDIQKLTKAVKNLTEAINTIISSPVQNGGNAIISTLLSQKSEDLDDLSPETSSLLLSKDENSSKDAKIVDKELEFEVEIESTDDPEIDTITEQPTIDAVAEQPTINTITEQPIIDTVAEQPIIDTVAEQPIIDTVAEQPIIDTVAEQPIIDTVAEQPTKERSISSTPGKNKQKCPNDGSPKHRDMIDRAIINARKDKMTFQAIAAKLMDDGIKTITGKEKWSSSTVNTAFQSAKNR